MATIKLECYNHGTRTNGTAELLIDDDKLHIFEKDYCDVALNFFPDGICKSGIPRYVLKRPRSTKTGKNIIH